MAAGEGGGGGGRGGGRAGGIDVHAPRVRASRRGGRRKAVWRVDEQDWALTHSGRGGEGTLGFCQGPTVYVFAHGATWHIPWMGDGCVGDPSRRVPQRFPYCYSHLNNKRISSPCFLPEFHVVVVVVVHVFARSCRKLTTLRWLCGCGRCFPTRPTRAGPAWCRSPATQP